MYQYDSRKIKKNDIFLCLPGGEAYIQDAIERGAAEIIKATRKEMAEYVKAYYQDPSSKLCVIGVTGTNGKTSVTQWVYQALKTCGYNVYVQGTLSGNLTTPESLDTLKNMKEHLDNGGTHFVMEVSSHAIAQDRIEGITFHTKLLTNITQDHLDFHKTFEAYKNTKLQFMNEGNAHKIFPEEYEKEVITSMPDIPGEFNLKNLKSTQSILKKIGLNQNQIAQALPSLTPPPGRFEFIRLGQPYWVIVDYAHTPDGLQNILEEAHRIKKKNNRVILVFGCGGERDRGKRPQMGKIAHQLADKTIITSDNPRHEDPRQIIADILLEIPKNDPSILVIEDRYEAVKSAIQSAEEGDVVILAGKGHETTQIINDQKLPFDDKQVAKEAIERWIPKHGH
jgi:UDP-N-acetylmuramoyl-L-alanyl-D-glutamate--2,6-diaminopimelate ligase